MAPPRSSSTSSGLKAALLLTAAGALLVLLGPFGTGVAVAGVCAAIAGTILAAPFADRPGVVAGWWAMLAAGALLAAVGVGIGFAVESVGGLVRILGGGLLAVGVALAYPPGR
ncbi:MAG TPA: hypothetical protein VF030_07610 [Solirubrobacterales bacterium]